VAKVDQLMALVDQLETQLAALFRDKLPNSPSLSPPTAIQVYRASMSEEVFAMVVSAAQKLWHGSSFLLARFSTELSCQKGGVQQFATI